jgi:hypothetical protein
LFVVETKYDRVIVLLTVAALIAALIVSVWVDEPDWTLLRIPLLGIGVISRDLRSYL